MKPRAASPTPNDSSGGLSRRRDMRLDAPRSLRVAMPSAKGKVTVSDISMGGLSLVVANPLALKTTHAVTLTLGSLQLSHKVRVMHCRRDPGGWRLGMAFVDAPLPGGATVDQLFNAILTSAITFS